MAGIPCFTPPRASAAASDAPYLGAISLRVPPELGNRRLAEMGLVDVTAAPFTADASGKTDSTAALQEAIVFAREHQMVAFFPPGVYTVSDTLECVHGRHDPATRRTRPGGRDWPCILVGSRRAAERPRIVLAPRSPGFDDPQRPKYVIHFWARAVDEGTYEQPQPNINMNQMLVGIDVVVGPGDPGAVGVRHRAAQGSSIQDCTIDATHGYCGLEGGAGSGGGHVNVTVIGGRIGADLRETQPASTVTGLTLIGQTETAILCAGRQATTLVGLRIETDAAGPLIRSQQRGGPHNGQLCLVDSRIVFRKPGTENTAIAPGASLYMSNVYVRGAATIVRPPDGPPLAGGDGWTRVGECALGIRPPLTWPRAFKVQLQYEAPVYVDGKRLDEPVLAAVEPASQPPEDLQSQHVWDATFPDWEAADVANVKQPPYGAAGDGFADDAAAIQRAIDERRVVLLPKGIYRTSRTIHLKPDTRLLGVGRCFTWLMPLGTADGDFTDPGRPQPVVQTADDAQSDAVLAFLGIRTTYDAPGSYCLRWQAGRRSIFRAVNVVAPQWWTRPKGEDVLLHHPLVLADGHGGGRWYNFHQEGSRGQAPEYRHLLVRGTSEPLRFYQCNTEYARSDANMELRGARFVSIYGLKGEYSQPILWVRDCDHVRVFGYGGNAAAWAGKSLLIVERTPNFLLANLVDTPRFPGSGDPSRAPGDGVDPRLWHMVREVTPEGETILTRPLDRPVLYRRGQPAGRGLPQ